MHKNEIVIDRISNKLLQYREEELQKKSWDENNENFNVNLLNLYQSVILKSFRHFFSSFPYSSFNHDIYNGNANKKNNFPFSMQSQSQFTCYETNFRYTICEIIIVLAEKCLSWKWMCVAACIMMGNFFRWFGIDGKKTKTVMNGKD